MSLQYDILPFFRKIPERKYLDVMGFVTSWSHFLLPIKVLLTRIFGFVIINPELSTALEEETSKRLGNYKIYESPYMTKAWHRIIHMAFPPFFLAFSYYFPFQLPHTEQLHCITHFHHVVPSLDLADHGLNILNCEPHWSTSLYSVAVTYSVPVLGKLMKSSSFNTICHYISILCFQSLVY